MPSVSELFADAGCDRLEGYLIDGRYVDGRADGPLPENAFQICSWVFLGVSYSCDQAEAENLVEQLTLSEYLDSDPREIFSGVHLVDASRGLMPQSGEVVPPASVELDDGMLGALDHSISTVFMRTTVRPPDVAETPSRRDPSS